SVGQSQTFSYGGYSPAHYLKQFLPKYSSEAEANKRAKEQGYETRVRMLHVKKDWQLNPELPTIAPWNCKRPINTPTWAMERNPYYWAVDTEGNQLPYIDNIVMTLAEDLEVVNLRAMAGEYDEQERHINLLKLPVIPGPEWRTKWSTLDLAAANKKLDEIGLAKKDRDGFRVRTDNGQRLVIQIQAVNALLPWPQHAEMISQHWRRAGVYAEVKE